MGSVGTSFQSRRKQVSGQSSLIQMVLEFSAFTAWALLADAVQGNHYKEQLFSSLESYLPALSVRKSKTPCGRGSGSRTAGTDCGQRKEQPAWLKSINQMHGSFGSLRSPQDDRRDGGSFTGNSKVAIKSHRFSRRQLPMSKVAEAKYIDPSASASPFTSLRSVSGSAS